VNIHAKGGAIGSAFFVAASVDMSAPTHFYTAQPSREALLDSLG
jgi:hypothetical protein